MANYSSLGLVVEGTRVTIASNIADAINNLNLDTSKAIYSVALTKIGVDNFLGSIIYDGS